MLRSKIVFGLLISGCLLELDGYDSRLWCVEAVGANGTRQATNANVNITKNGDWIGFCRNMCEFEDEILQQGADGDIGPMHPLHSQWQDLQDDIRFAAEGWCLHRVGELVSSGGAIVWTGVGDLTCEDALAAQIPVRGDKALIPEEACDTDMGGTAGGEESPEDDGEVDDGEVGSASADVTGGGDVGPDIYGLTSYNQVRSCTTNSTAKTITCNLDKDFVRFVAADYELIWNDDATLTSGTLPSGGTGIKFQTCGTTSLLYALGFRTNDVISTIDGNPVASFEDGLDMFGLLGGAQYTGSPATVKFYRSGILWTMTVNRTNFSTYP